MSRLLGAAPWLWIGQDIAEPVRWPWSVQNSLIRPRSWRSEHAGGSRRTLLQTRLVLTWVVRPGQEDPARQRLLFSWQVFEAPGTQSISLRFYWDVLPPTQRLLFLWDVIPSEMVDATSSDRQQPVAHVTLTPSREFRVRRFTVQSSLGRPADLWMVETTGLGAYRGRSPNDRITLEAGLVQNGQRVLWPLITRGLPNDYAATFSPTGMPVTGRVSGRDRMSALQDGTYAMVYRNGPTPAVVSGALAVPERNGLFWASDVARDVATACGLRLAWQCPDYRINDVFNAVGRPLDILVALVRPFSLVPARQVDVFTFGDTVYVRQRQLRPAASAALTFTAHDLRLSNLQLRSFQTDRIGRVILRGRRSVGGSPGGVSTTPPGGVPIPHDTELQPSGGGAPIAIYASLPPESEAVLLPATGQPWPNGIVQQADGSTLGVGLVAFTADRIAVADLEGVPGWALPTGTIVQPDGLLRIMSAPAKILPPAFRYVYNSDGTVTVVHP